MKIRRSIIVIIIIALALIVLMLWHGSKQPTTTPLAISTENNTMPSMTVSNASVNSLIHTNTPVTQRASNVSTPPPMESKGQQMREGLAELNDEDIVLYGRAIDQFNSPVIGATVMGSVQVNNGTRTGTDKFSLLTDANGFFTISGHKGKAIGINVNKTGYVMAATNTYFIYSLLWPESQRYVPDPNNPPVIKMWKLQGAEPLVDISKEYKLPFPSEPIFFDLVAGKIVPSGGDIEITVNRPAGEVSEHNPQKWSINLEAVGGGFIETSGRESAITFAAPEDGYQPSGTFENNNGPDLVDKAFFVKSRNGQVFGKYHLWFRINDQPNDLIYVKFSGVANTGGSRNWEATVPK